MATSKINQGFVPALLSTDYTDYLTLETDVTISSFRLEQLDKNIWAVFIAGAISTPVSAHDRKNIATYDLTKLPPVAGYIGGYVFQEGLSSVYKPGVGFFLNTGVIRVINLSDSAISGFSFNGMVYRRI